MKTNKKAKDYRKDESTRLAGGYGPFAAKQNAEALLRRSVMANLLWEDNFYEDGVSIVDHIKSLVPKVEPQKVFDIAVEARTKQKLRHVPLLLAREMVRYPGYKTLVKDLLPRIILRADELTEFMALYWRDNKTHFVSNPIKKGMNEAFARFDAYQFGKYNRNTEVKFRDVMRVCHIKTPQGKKELYDQIRNDEIPIPDTWEVALSTGKDKKKTWERLIKERKLGALAFVRNLRNMVQAGVPDRIILDGFQTINPTWLLPINYIAAAREMPKWERELEQLMFRGFERVKKLPGYTILVVDVSGSMMGSISAKSTLSRIDAGGALCMLASEFCERVSLYATAGSDSRRIHATKALPPRRGFGVMDLVENASDKLGGGGIFTRQCLEFIQEKEKGIIPDRIIVFSDSQDCDYPGKHIPKPFGKKNYIVDVSAHKRGIAYKGIWTAEISGWSEHFLTYIAGFEGLEVGDQGD